MSAYDIVSEELQGIAADNPEFAPHLQEALNRVNTMLQAEDRGWIELFSGITGGDIPGVDLEQAKEASALAREMAYGSPLVSRGLDLRTSYVWSKGVVIEGAPDLFETQDSSSRKRGPKNKKEKFFADPAIQRYILNPEAKRDMEAAAFTDGHFMFLGDEKTRTGHPLPFSEIDSVLLHPEYTGEVWAYRRRFNTYDPATQKSRERVVWYYVDTYTGPRTNPEPGKKVGQTNVEVDPSKTLFVKSFNTMIGWPIGVGDALPALKWARIYAEMVNDGKIVSKANAKFVYKVKNTTPKGAQNAAVKASNSKGVGHVASMGNNNDLVAIPQSNRSYDFNGLRPIAAQVATALNVSVVHILSDPGAAGSSYGSASNLDLPTKRAMVSRQQEWVDFLQRLIKWGTGEDLRVTFPSLDDPDPYREMQIVTMGWNSGTIHTDEMRDRTLSVGGFNPNHKNAPTGVMLPNNSKSLNRADVDNDSSTSDSNGVASTASSPDQGQRNGTGGVSDAAAKDQRTDTLESMIVELSRQVETLGQLVESRGYND